MKKDTSESEEDMVDYKRSESGSDIDSEEEDGSSIDSEEEAYCCI